LSMMRKRYCGSPATLVGLDAAAASQKGRRTLPVLAEMQFHGSQRAQSHD